MRNWKILAAAACLAAPSSVCLAQTGEASAAPTPAQQQPAAKDQAAPKEQAPAGPDAAKADAPPKQEELDQMLAPLALYPDDLLSQILMASTYPIEIVQADRWVQAHKSLKGDALAKELEKQTWDPSVKSLVNVPDVLASLSEKLDWTVKIGDAFLADQKAVLDTVQKLRQKAAEAGNLKTNEQQNVTTEVAGDTNTTIIKIESSDPEVIYVPSYNPTVVYGSWWYPSYPPPPPYYYNPAGAAFVGFACGVAWGYAWGGCSWGHSEVDIDIDRNVNRNTNIDRSKYQGGQRGGVSSTGGKGAWQHDASHRKGQAYGDSATAKKYGGTSKAQASQAREGYRGRSESASASQANRGTGGAAQGRGSSAGAAQRPATQGANRPSTGTGGAGGSAGTSSRGSAFEGSDRSGGDVRRQSNRGSTSRGGSASRGGSRGGGGRRGR
jgi:hypothetical protein